VNFRHAGQRLGIASLSHEVFAALGVKTPGDSKTWRKQYQRSFAQVCDLEVSNLTAIENALNKFLSLAYFGENPLHETLLNASKEKLVRIEKIGSSGTNKVLSKDNKSWFHKAEELVASQLAEPGLLNAASQLDSGVDLNDAPLLISFAGAAELAPTIHWLRWGGRALVLARPGNPRIKELIAQAKVSGELLLPVRNEAHGNLEDIAGMDLVREPELAASAIGQIAKSEKVIFGHYGYAPGFKHVELQAVAESLTRIAKDRFKSVLLNWLATPSDSVLVPKDFAAQRELAFNNRSGLRKVCDALWQIFGYLRRPVILEGSESTLVTIDASANVQGPSYSLAKRTQRWRAALEVAAGNEVSYQVTPPSETDSVLNYKILRYTYKGGKRFGSIPTSVLDGSQWPAALLALKTKSLSKAKFPEAYLDTAIHGGLWRTPYETESIWIPATVTGLLKFWK
jgi:hypothetical protein